jgi:Na+(H+)/acetate symporter ActP
MLQEEISPLANGMATAADWMSAASFISMAGIISFDGYDGAVYLMGWTGGFFCFFYLPHICENSEIYRSRFYWRTLLL